MSESVSGSLERVCESESPQSHSQNRRGVTSTSHISRLVEEEAPFQNTQKYEIHKDMAMGPDGAQNQERQCWRGPVNNLLGIICILIGKFVPVFN
jgi:hypothetical protein